MPEQRITFCCKLLEDLHSGSGLGRLKTVDDCHARDAAGRPVVWYSMLAGLLRDAADELCGLGHPLAEKDRIQRLFGTEGKESRAAIVCRSLHFHHDGALSRNTAEDAADRMFVNVISTSREVYSRRPLDETLRTIEYAVAGLIAHDGELRFRGDDKDHEKDAKLLELCLRRLVALGGGRTRGAGRIQLSKIHAETLSGHCTNLLLKGPPTRRVRVVLRNLEPLCLPATANPGNILETENYLPGQALRGAFLTALRVGGLTSGNDMDILAATTGAQFTNGYFVCYADPECGLPPDLAQLVSMPLPLTAQEAKATAQTAPTGNLPWWTKRTSRDRRWWSDPSLEQDTLWQDRNDESATAEATSSFKRVKTDDYLVSTDGTTWRRQWPAVATLMRNRAPVARQDRNLDSRRPDATHENDDLEKADLFSEMVLTEDQCFVCEVVFETENAATVFQRVAVPLLASEEDQRAWLRVGRGGRPMRIERAQWLGNSLTPQLKSGPDDKPNCFSLTLTSDLIVRAPNLTFRTTLDTRTLAKLAGCAEHEVGKIGAGVGVDPKASLSETRVVHGFNTAAGVRRTPALAIRRGSAFLIKPDGDDAEPARLLFNALAARETAGQGIGERLEEGFGRFVLNHPAHQAPPDDAGNPSERQNGANSGDSDGGQPTDPSPGSRAEREMVIEA
ncbi:MAG: RAMP superfamily CRISPR-associated protein, partial [Planctomycetota bacterium]